MPNPPVNKERAMLKSILASMVEGIVSISEDYRVIFCNSAAYRLLESDAQDCRGMLISELEGFAKLRPLVKKSLATRGLVEAELFIGDGDGRKRIETQANLIRTDEDLGVMVVLHDVTELRKLETVRRDFIANISHEIKTPLTSIRGYVETLLDGAIEDPKINKKFLSKIDANAQRLHGLVQDIISLSQIESQDAIAEKAPVEWRSIVNAVVSRYEVDLERKNLNISMPEEKPHHAVIGDKEAMSQVFENLLTNAIRYTPKDGSVSIRIEKDPGWQILVVSDTGVGVPESDLGRVFERFYRVDKARSRELGGTGLGLSIVRHLVQKMAGEVWLESTLNKGSSFFVKLPVAH